MNRRKEILDELREAAPAVAGIDPQHTYRVPEGYFESLPALIMLRIRTQNAGSAREEMDMISPLLGGITKKMPFSTPDGYFDTLIPDIHVASKEVHQPARVVKMFQPQRTFRMAAAAVTIGIIGLAAWLFIRQSTPANQYAVKPDTEVQKDLENQVSELSDMELANFADGSTYFLNYETNGLAEIKEEDVKLMLADIPDQELEKFLDQNTVKEQFN